MNARDIMRSDAPTARMGASIADLARLMLDNNVSGIPVVGDGGKYLGLVTEKDLVTKHANVHVPVYLGILGAVIPFERRGTDEEIQRVLAVTAGDLMEADAETVGPEASVEDVATVMVDKDAEPVPVVEGGRLLGLVSRRDIIGLLLVEEGDTEPSGG